MMKPRKVAAAPADALSTAAPATEEAMVVNVVYCGELSSSLRASLLAFTTITTRRRNFPCAISDVRLAGEPGVVSARLTAVRPRLSMTPPSTRRTYRGRRNEFGPALKESRYRACRKVSRLA